MPDLAQNAWKQIQKKGLIEVYGIQTVRVLMRCFPSLSFLPPDEVPEAFEDICEAVARFIGDPIPQRFSVPLNGKQAQNE